MILKKHNHSLLIFILLVALLSTFASFSKQNFKILTYDMYESLMNKNPGFSSTRNIFDAGGQYWPAGFVKKIKPIVLKIDDIFSHMANKDTPNLEKIKIVIKFKNYRKILNDRKIALKKGFLENPTNVNAILYHKGKKHKARVRLKGDLHDHWFSKHRLSLKISLKNGSTIMGMNSFSIHKPKSRQHPYEQAFQATMKKVNNLSANHNYAFVEINNENWGIMNIEETISEEYLEKSRKKPSLIFSFSDDLFWKNYNMEYNKPYQKYRLSNERLYGRINKSKKHLKNTHHRKIYTYVMDSRLKKNHPYLYSTNEHMRLFLNSLMWNNFHTMANANSKYYFNPYTLKLSPISTDQSQFKSYKKPFLHQLAKTKLPLNFEQVLANIGSEGTIKKTYNEAINSQKNLHFELNRYRNIFPLDQLKSDKLVKKNIKTISEKETDFINFLVNYKKPISSKERFLKPNEKQASYFYDHVHVRHFDNGKISIFNLLPFTINIEKILINKIDIGVKKFTVPGFKPHSFQPVTLQTKFTGILDNNIEVNTSYRGNFRTTKAIPTMITKDVFNPLLENNIKKFPFINKLKNNKWIVKKGNWIVKEPIILNGDLIINPGVNISFGENAYLIIKGSLNVRGTSDSKIIFRAIKDNWKGIYLLSNNEPSFLSNLIVKDTTALSSGILNLTGGFTVYSSDLKINNLSIESSRAEDGLNIVNSKVDIKNLKIKQTESDGLDCDFCKGVISNANISLVGGDALDFSGSEMKLEKLLISDVKDKAISVGENTNIIVQDSDFFDTGVGIASKDGSVAKLFNVSIKDYELYAAMTYQKKKIFNKNSELNIFSSTISGDKPFLRQTGTKLTVDNIPIKESKIKVKKLYSSGIMKK